MKGEDETNGCMRRRQMSCKYKGDMETWGHGDVRVEDEREEERERQVVRRGEAGEQPDLP